ncbi:hypothetical protein CC86DRAFT_296989 [Ophiobolus disseminans]|uniref:F-box domain-containing protein n=1 Tax=Ophiobolus disseminans TaxID=1469910 RepID=A0A6A6ZTK5_9PLEO|nr:hypothetical protein CC86DRAFT_296989 [Ophiobolus disseminans]
MGKEQIVIDDDEGVSSYKDNTKPFVRKGHFRLMDLPAELRVYVYSYLLPYNVAISFEQNVAFKPSKKQDPWWLVEATSKDQQDTVPIAMGRQHWNLRSRKARNSDDWLRVQTQIFLVNKEVSNEARAVLYGSNTYKFTIDGSAHFPVSLASPLIFGPFGDKDGLRLPLLRNLRSIYIEVLLNADSHWAIKRQRSRLECFVDVLKQHSDDEDRKSLLQELTICVRIPVTPPRHHYTQAGTQITIPTDAERYMFGLENLSMLCGIKDVRISGLPDWYMQCLKLCIQGKGGEVQGTDWPLVQVKRTLTSAKWTKKTKQFWVTTRKWYQPTLNWKEYALRNSIDTPEDIDKYWIAEN